MRKKVSGLILCFALLFSLPLSAFAANQVNTMDIQAVIYEDGSMYVTQVWEGDFTQRMKGHGLTVVLPPITAFTPTLL